MAIDRTIGYYKQWTNKRGWIMRLEIIPAGEFVDSATNIDCLTFEEMERGLIAIKSHKSSFDKIVFGVRDAQSIEFEFELRDMQANLVNLLKNPFFNHASEGYSTIQTTNIFVLKSDRGTGADPTFIEFAGGQKATLSNKYSVSKESSNFVATKCTVEAIDILKLVFEQTTTQFWATSILEVPNNTYLKSRWYANYLYEYSVIDSGQITGKYDYVANNKGASGFGLQTYAYLYAGAHLFNEGLIRAIKVNLSAWTRNNFITYNIECNDNPFTSITFYKQNSYINHAKGDSLSDTQVLVVGRISSNSIDNDGGMLVSDKGGESYLEFVYLWDLLKNVCECMCSKLTYNAAMINDTLGEPRLSYKIYFNKLFRNPSNSVQDLRDRFADAQEGEFDFTPCSSVFTSVTSELSNMDSPDIARFEERITGTNSDERMNIKLIHHNLPTANIKSTRVLRESRIHARKLYYTNSNSAVKVHESVQISDGINTTVYDNPTPLPNLVASDTFESELRVEQARGWAIDEQINNNLAVAVARFYLDRFSNAAQNEITVTMYLSDGETMPENVGDLVRIPAIAGFDSTEYASIVSMETNWDEGTAQITLLTRGSI